MTNILNKFKNQQMELKYNVYHFLLFIFIIFVSGVTVEATSIYYVNATDGNDLNDGLSETTAWRTLNKVNNLSFSPGDEILFKRGEIWREQLIPYSGDVTGHIKYGAYGTGNKPLLLGSLTKNDTNDWNNEGGNIWSTSGLSKDVGNLIFNDEASVGVKVRNEEELDTQGKFWYDEENLLLKIYSQVNPAIYYSNIECALNRFIINEYHINYVIYENLHLKYGGSHGIGGGNVHHIIVRDCDFSYIGGSRLDDQVVRYGNGIEFMDTTHDTLVERCRLWEIYDAALTTQGGRENNQKYNQYFRNNIIWNSEYCFEYWNRPESATTHDIYFENNTCVKGGYGWGHNQRWKETDAGWHNGKHLAFYDNAASTHGLYIRNNIFYKAKNALYSVESEWTGDELAVLDYNALYQDSPQLIHYPPCIDDQCGGYECESYDVDEFMEFQAETGKDKHSLVTNPLFIDEDNNDFRPAKGGPVCTMSQSGSYVGALPCVHVNVPPSLPKLIFPVNGQTLLDTTIAFKWERSKSPESHKVTYILSICEDENISIGCITKEITASVVNKIYFYAGTGLSFLIFGLSFIGGIRNRRNNVLLFAVLLIFIVLLISCSGGTGENNSIVVNENPSGEDGGNNPSQNNNEITQKVFGLKAGTTYYWKVDVNDENGGIVESEVRSFTTQYNNNIYR